MCCVVIPVYKEFHLLSNEELVSLRQLYKVLGKHQMTFIGPPNLKWENYLQHAMNKNILPLIKTFPIEFFSSVEGYSKLMISRNFFNSFKKYKHILVYQLDADGIS